MSSQLMNVQQVKQAEVKDLLNNYFWAHGLDQVKRESEIKQFCQTFGDLSGFKQADLETIASYIQPNLSLRSGLVSAMEIGARMIRSIPNINGQVFGRESFGEFLVATMQGLEQEQLWLISLDTKHQILATDVLHIGSLRSCPFHIRDILRRALQLNAQGIIIAHNHPSGNAIPSKNDIRLSNELAQFSNVFEVTLVDSFVVGAENYASLREEDLLKMPE